jgi:hypothetical protein
MSNATTLQAVPDPELGGPVLDLGRPELRSLMERYVSEPARRTPALLDPPTALVVGRSPGEDEPVRQALREEGWTVVTCEGPSVEGCPVMRGNACPLRASADAAVVYVSPGAPSLPRLRCAADSASPAVVAVESSFDPPRYGTSTATVGALRGPQAVMKALHRLLDPAYGSTGGAR